MKYTIEVNHKTVTVTLDGYKGVARCCDEDSFNLQTGIELALERAKVAKANGTKKECCGCDKCDTITNLAKRMEAILPPDGIIVVGKGDKMSNAQKNYLARLIGKSTDDRYDEGYEAGYEEGHEDGYEEGYDEGRDSGYDEGYDAGRDLTIHSIQGVLENLTN